jgi:hypothetical protein
MPASTAPVRLALRGVLLLGALLLGALLLGAVAAPPARAGDEPPEDAGDAVVAAYLEGLNLRLRAKADEARLLEALGEKARALDALREVGELQKAGQAVVERLLARPRAAAPAPGAAPAGPREEPLRIDPDAPDRALVAAACAFLARAQRPDGLVDPGTARAEGDPAAAPGRAPAVTAAAVLAWLDASDYLGRSVGRGDDRAFARTIEAAAARGAEALVAGQAKAGRLGGAAETEGAAGDEVEDHLLAAWALAAARSRFGRAEWDEPLARAVALALAAQGEDGWWEAVGDDRDATALRTAFAFALLQEVVLLPLPKARAAAVETAMWRAQMRALALPASTVAHGRPSGVVSRALLLRRALTLGEVRRNTEYRLEPDPHAPLFGGETPERRLEALEDGFWPRFDPAEGPRVAPGAVALAFGTAYAWGGTAAGWQRWRDRVLAPALAGREKDGPAAGTWSPALDPRGERYGRAYTTAFHLLAALHPVVPFRAPKGP